MKFSEKKIQTLFALYEQKFDGKYHDISVLLKDCSITISQTEAIQIGKALENDGFINLAASRDGASALITGDGVEFVEEYDTIQEDEQTRNFTEGELVVLNKKLDELLKRITKMELGQQIIYDDIRDELDELRELTKVLSKKNWFQQLQGKLLSIGLGKLSDEALEIIESTFGGNQLST